MYEPFLDAGYTPADYWDYTPGMIADAVTAHTRKQERQAEKEDGIFKAFLSALYVQSMEIRDGTSSVLNPEGRLHELSYYYPGIFPPAEEAAEEAQQSEEDRILAMQKAAMDDLVYYHNRAFRAKHNTENPEVEHNDTAGTESLTVSTD